MYFCSARECDIGCDFLVHRNTVLLRIRAKRNKTNWWLENGVGDSNKNQCCLWFELLCRWVVSRYMHTPCQPHFEVVCRIVHYLKGALGCGLLYSPSASLSVTGFGDAKWVSSRFDRPSTSGYCTFVGNYLVT